MNSGTNSFTFEWCYIFYSKIAWKKNQNSVTTNLTDDVFLEGSCTLTGATPTVICCRNDVPSNIQNYQISSVY